MKLLCLLVGLLATALAQPLISYHTPKGWYVYNVQGKAILTPTTHRLASPPSLPADRYLRAELLVKEENGVPITRYVLVDDQGKTWLNSLPGNLKPIWVWQGLVGVLDVASSFSGVVSLADGKTVVKPVYTYLTQPVGGKYLYFTTPDRQSGVLALPAAKEVFRKKGYEISNYYQDQQSKAWYLKLYSEQGEELHVDMAGKATDSPSEEMDLVWDEDYGGEVLDGPAPGADFEVTDNGRGGLALMRGDDTLTANLTLTTQPLQVCNGLMVYADKTNPSLIGVATLAQQVLVPPAPCQSIDIQPHSLVRYLAGGKVALYTLQGKPLAMDDLANVDKYWIHLQDVCGPKPKWPTPGSLRLEDLP